jgi:hypothetical protein
MPALECKTLAPEVYTLADTYQLGTPQKEFRVRPTRNHIISSALLIAVSLCLGVVTFLLFTGQNPNRLLCALFICAAVVALATGFAILLKPVRHRSRYVYLCSDGFLFIEGKNICGSTNHNTTIPRAAHRIPTVYAVEMAAPLCLTTFSRTLRYSASVSVRK